MRLVVGSDHAGCLLKRNVVEHFAALGHDVVDVGSFDDRPVDFPDIASGVAADTDFRRRVNKLHDMEAGT